MNERSTPESIGQRLRRLRTERGLSQRELASPGVSYAYISRIEAGTRQPSVKALRMLARKLGVTADYLETGMEVGQREQREIRLANAELHLRLAPDTTAAEDELRAVLEESLQAGDLQHASRARIGLGLAAAQSGRADEAIALLEAEVDEGATLPAARPDVYATLGHAYASAGMAPRAVKLFERCLDDARGRTPDDYALQVRYASYLSYALTDAGDHARARDVLTDVLDTAESIDDPYTRVRAYWGLARLHGTSGNSSLALDYYRRAISLLESTDDTLHLARAHLAAASVLIDDDRAGEAASHLAKAEQLFGPGAEKADVAYLRTEQARRSIRLGEATEATQRARQALELLGESEPGEQGSAWLVLGEALALQKEVPAASEAFRRAIDLLGPGSRFKDCARAYKAWGRVLRDAGREAEAFDAFEKAAEFAERSADARAPR